MNKAIIDRLCAALAFFMVQMVHQHFFAFAPNTPEGMLLYHGSAALADFAIIALAAHCLQGQLSLDIQRLNLASMVVNALGWIFYLAYLSPTVYNLAIVTIGYVQWIRLLWVDSDNVNHTWAGLVRSHHSGCPKFHLGKAS